MHSGQDHRAILASQMKWDSDDDREEMRWILQSLGISVAWSAWSQILVTSGTKRRNQQGPEGRNSGERRVQRPRWLSAPWNCI